MTPDVRVLHASDVHVDNGPDGTAGIIRLCDAAVRLDIDLLVLVGDSFDDNRPNDDARREFAEQLARVPVPVVVLPGNHDPLVPGCVYDRMELAGHVTVLRAAGGETLRFDALGRHPPEGRAGVADRPGPRASGARPRGPPPGLPDPP